MKKLLIVLLILVLLSPLIDARLINITKTDFYNEPTQAYELQEGNGISFIKDGKDYVITVDLISENSVRLSSFAYINNSKEVFYMLLTKQFSNRIDFERDNIYDMKINLLKLDNANKTVDLLFQSISEPRNQNQTSNNIQPTATNSSLKTGLIITSLIIVIGLLIYFFMRKK